MFRYEVLSVSRARKYTDHATGEIRYRLDVVSVSPLSAEAKRKERREATAKTRREFRAAVPKTLSVKGHRLIKDPATGALRSEYRAFSGFIDPPGARTQTLKRLVARRDAWAAAGEVPDVLKPKRPSLL